MIQEPCFIPRAADSAEGGYIVAVIDDLATNYSELVILEALRLPDGPIARLKIPFRLRSGLHGNWCDISEIAGS